MKPTRPEPGLKAMLRRWRERRRAASVVTAWALPSAATADAVGADAVSNVNGASEAGAPASGPGQLAPVTGTYLTTGGALLRVEHVHTDCDSGTTFVELEDCATMELTICTADSLAAQKLRSVVPIPVSERPAALAMRRENARTRAGWAAAPR